MQLWAERKPEKLKGQGEGGGKMENRDGGGEGRGEVGEIQGFFITTSSLSSVHTQGSLSSRSL